MAFSEHLIKQAWIRSGARCECIRTSHGHPGRCNRTLLESYRGELDTRAGWEATSKSGSFRDLADCEILCRDCQKEVHYL
jgi:hypothetical protein